MEEVCAFHATTDVLLVKKKSSFLFHTLQSDATVSVMAACAGET